MGNPWKNAEGYTDPTAYAALKAVGHYIGWEIDPGYFQICCDRLDEVED